MVGLDSAILTFISLVEVDFNDNTLRTYTWLGSTS